MMRTMSQTKKRKIIVSEFVTLDGVMESPEKWQFPYYSDDLAEFNKSQILALDALLLGRVTYEIFASYWPFQTSNEVGYRPGTNTPEDVEIANKLNSAKKYVVSRTLDEVNWNNSTLIKGNVAEEITRLKQQPGGDIGITGSAALVQTLMQNDLIDEYRLFIYPIIVGSGKHLFMDGSSMILNLVGTKTFKSGVVLL